MVRTTILKIDLDRFDLAVAVSAVALLLIIGIVIALGDHTAAPVGVQSIEPSGMISSHSAVRLTFSEPVDSASIAQHFAINPAVKGSVSVSGNQAVFSPAAGWQPGQSYRVTISAGLAMTSGRVLAHDWTTDFAARPFQIVFLNGNAFYAVDPAQPSAPRLLLNSPNEITDYDVSYDGTKIAYIERLPVTGQKTQSTRLMIWDRDSGKSESLYECQEAACSHPLWRPDGSVLSFERADLNPNLVGGPGNTRIWLIDIATHIVSPLFKDSQRLGRLAVWSPDKPQIAVFDDNFGEIVIHDLSTGQDLSFPGDPSQLIRFSPDGQKLVSFTGTAKNADQGIVTSAQIIDLSGDPTEYDLALANEPLRVPDIVWSNDSWTLFAVWQSYTDPSPDGPQVYSVDSRNGQVRLRVPGQDLNGADYSLDPSGNVLLFDGASLSDATNTPQIWIYNLADGKLKRVADRGIAPRWLP